MPIPKLLKTVPDCSKPESRLSDSLLGKYAAHRQSQFCKDLFALNGQESSLQFLNPSHSKQHILRVVPCNKKIVMIMEIRGSNGSSIQA